jgi:hypothetical protein
LSFHPDNKNREDRLSLRGLWKPLTHSVKKEKVIFKKMFPSETPLLCLSP